MMVKDGRIRTPFRNRRSHVTVLVCPTDIHHRAFVRWQYMSDGMDVGGLNYAHRHIASFDPGEQGLLGALLSLQHENNVTVPDRAFVRVERGRLGIRE